jgi:hypothetical protein
MTTMISEDDKRFYELYCKQVIHRKRRNIVAKMPERVYDNFDREKKQDKDIEAKYENKLADTAEDKLLKKIFGE